MAKTRSNRSRSRSRKSSQTRSQKGGDLNGNPASAWGWVQGTVGNGFKQFTDSLTLQPGQNLATRQSNDIVPVNNPNANNAQPYLKPNMTGGRRKRSKRSASRRRSARRSRGKKGGSLSAIISQAIPPFLLLGAQQMYGKRKSRKH
jgi:hypothetical protein